jgi:dTDP-glucose 4,6-dehydratase
MKKKKVLVTGSGGFIFGNFIRQVFYNKKPYTISSIDKVRESHIIHNIYTNSDHNFYIADVLDQHTLRVIFEKERPSLVIHGAAESNVDKSISDPSVFVKNNTVGTQNIINECLHFDSKLIYMSTDEVLGSLGLNDKPWDESQPLNPKNAYSASKASGEFLLAAASNVHGLNYAIVRSCNNYGPWQTHEKLIPRIIKCVLENENIPIYGKGDQIRDWIHVYDTCSAIFSIIDNWRDNEIYNISAGQEFMNLEVAQIICNALGKGHELITHVEDRLGHDVRYALDNSKIKSLGWSPQVKFRQGVEQTCQWFMNNQYVLKM